MSKTQTTAPVQSRNKPKINANVTAPKKASTTTTVKAIAKKSTSAPKSTKTNEEKNAPQVVNASRSTEPRTSKVTTSQKTKPTTTTIKTKSDRHETEKRNTADKLRNQVTRAKDIPKKADTHRMVNATSLGAKASKPNAVLDSYHNVTVASPPPKRKSITDIEEHGPLAAATQETTSTEKRARTRTRTLEPEEVVVLRNESAKQRIEAQIQAQNEAVRSTPKEPVAFEVLFDETVKPTESRDVSRNRSKSRTRQEITRATATDDGEANYSDDFESYESDFETGSSSPATPTETDENDDSENGSDNTENDHSETHNDDDDDNGDDNDNDDDESDLTQYPVTVIQRDKELERKLDSGNYEMNSRKQLKLTEGALQQFDSLDTFSGATSEQLDSGMSSYGNNASQTESKTQKDTVFYGGYAEFNTRPVWNTRGRELMSKIQFDTLTFSLFELKPISYDVYMQTYGKLNTTQSSSQTNDNRMTTDCQTEDYEVRSMWTQHPPQYDIQTVQKMGTLGTLHNCCGESTENANDFSLNKQDELDEAIQSLAEFRSTESDRSATQQLRGFRKPIDFDKLHSFLLNSSILMSKVLNAGSAERHLENRLTTATPMQAAFSLGYTKLGTRFLNALRVIRVFANAKHNLIITIHESLPEADVYRSDFANLLVVWSNERNEPMRLLSAWSEVCRAEICNDTPDILVCGLRDGSVAMWDLRETYSFCSKLDGNLTHFAATQSIVPTWNTETATAKALVDLGAVVDVRSFRSRPKTLGMSHALSGYKSIQFASLNDTGILTIWTLVETNANLYEFSSTTVNSRSQKNRTPPNHASRFEYSSPWARVKLTQSAICDLRSYLESSILKAQSHFDRTKFLFEKNIYSDEVLRELNETNSELNRGETQLQGLRFTCIDTACESVYVCTNRNFILICSKSLKTERFRKISINESRFLFPTALRVLANEDFLAIGLSNGSVMVLNCNQSKALQKKKKVDSDKESATKDARSNLSDFDLKTGKSCAIQNIILNERRSFDEGYEVNYESRPNTAACIDLITNQRKPFELRIYDQQLLLSGSMLRRHLVQSLELSSDGWHLFALSDGEVRTYDFYLDREVPSNGTDSTGLEKVKILDIAVSKPNNIQQNLVMLTSQNDVEVHILKQ